MNVAYRDAYGSLEASFGDGVVVQIHRTKSGRFYTLKPYFPHEPGRMVPAEERNRYQHAALTGFFSGAKVKIAVDADGDLFGEP